MAGERPDLASNNDLDGIRKIAPPGTSEDGLRKLAAVIKTPPRTDRMQAHTPKGLTDRPREFLKPPSPVVLVGRKGERIVLPNTEDMPPSRNRSQ